MRLLVLDGTAITDAGSGSAAYFSRGAVNYLRYKGHTVKVLNAFDPGECEQADLVWCEWANEVAFAAAHSGLCKHLVLRIRGYDVWAPFDKLNWDAIDCVMYESQTLKDLAHERFPDIFKSIQDEVLPSGIDLERFAYKKRKPGPVMAMVCRALADKGYQLALEYARQHPDVIIHMTAALGEHNVRLVRYLQHAAPNNVVLHGTVDPAVWLNEIDANYLLVPSNWETLSYAVAEAMAMGIKPLIHDFPGAGRNWPKDLVWASFQDLDRILEAPYESERYRRYVDERYDQRVQSRAFLSRLMDIAGRPSKGAPVATPRASLDLHGRLQAGDFETAEKILVHMAERYPREAWIPMALALAAAHSDEENWDKAAFFAQMTMRYGPRVDAMAVLAESAIGEDELEAAGDWCLSAAHMPKSPDTVLPDLVDSIPERLAEIEAELEPPNEPSPAPFFKIIVPVRNGAKWITECLKSIAQQDAAFDCIVIDDASEDGTGDIVADFVKGRENFIVIRQTYRQWSLSNIVQAVRHHGSQDPEDVIVVVDGDDMLAGSRSLQAVAKRYERGAWMTYGTHTDTKGVVSTRGAYRYKVVERNSYREDMWRGTHLKTFKRWLFDRVHDSAFKDDNSEWFRIAGDVALMIPMLEMAGHRAHFVEDVVYVYNDDSPDNDHKTDSEGQIKARNMIMRRPPYPRLKEKP